VATHEPSFYQLKLDLFETLLGRLKADEPENKEERDKLRRATADIKEDLSLSALATACKELNILEVSVKNTRRYAAGTEINRAQIELCKTAATSSDAKIRESAVACIRNLTKPTGGLQTAESVPGKSVRHGQP
jgi:hypothetical protein